LLKTANKIVFKSSIDTFLIIVLFLKIILIVDLDDFFYLSIFSRFFSTFPQTPAAHLRTLHVTPCAAAHLRILHVAPVCRGTPADPSRRTSVPRHTCGSVTSHQCAAAHLRILHVAPVCRGTPADPSHRTSVPRHTG
jgi:hypothetical protein